jgi:leucine-rich repeat protein SHOC2
VPTNFANLSNLTYLNLQNNKFSTLPFEVTNLSNLTTFILSYKQIMKLSDSIEKLTKLTHLFLCGNKLTYLPTSISKLSKIRRVLTQQFGYERICKELDAIELNNWREYTLLAIDDIQRFYNWETQEEISREPMVFLKSIWGRSVSLTKGITFCRISVFIKLDRL